MKKIINYGSHYINNADILAVAKALRQTKITQGTNVELFEEKLKSFFNSKYSSVVSNGTAALHLAMLSLNLSNKDKVVTSPISFLASANCVEYVGAQVDFCDIDRDTYSIDPNYLEHKLKKDKKIKAVIVVDYAGHPADWASFLYLKKKYNIILINDNCHALGSKMNNDSSYALKYADIVTQSFHPVKNITTGEGGAIMTNNQTIFNKIKLLRNHGMEKDSSGSRGMWHYSMNTLGYNYRLSDINCALGISQFKKLEKFISKKRDIADSYRKYLPLENVKLPIERKNFYHAYHLYPILIDFKKINKNKKYFFKEMSKSKIFLQVHYIPIHLQNYYKKKYGFKKGDFTNSENFYEQEVSLPIYYGLKKNEQIKVINKIKRVLFD